VTEVYLGKGRALPSLAAVSAGYGSFRALFDVSLEVPQAGGRRDPRTPALARPRCARHLRLVPLRGGAMTLEGRPVGGFRSMHGRAGHQHVPETGGRFAADRRGQSAHRRFHPAARQRFGEQLERVYELFPLRTGATSWPTLSGGEQQ
jgi:branched-chain amino acid transport system ATP-binding protein